MQASRRSSLSSSDFDANYTIAALNTEKVDLDDSLGGDLKAVLTKSEGALPAKLVMVGQHRWLVVLAKGSCGLSWNRCRSLWEKADIDVQREGDDGMEDVFK